MKVPLLDLREQNAALRTELDAAYARVMGSSQFIMGPEVTELETACVRSEERRVGKECRSRWSPYH